ncbi:MAG: GGDEF domain-containing protein [Alphaproteobacteria bacterium]|nr:GGDEF domain-containing protein [Alphaproteobacteria bacterium]
MDSLSAILDRIGLRDRILAAAAACLLILLVDLKTSATLVTAIMYTPVAALFHRVRNPSVFVGFAVVVTLFTLLGAWTELTEADLPVMLLNRSVALLIVYAMTFMVYRNGVSSTILQRLATTDPLTGVFNRRHYMDLMSREQRRADRYGIIYSVLMIDLDRFKRINDSYGHQIGDQAIRAVAEAARRALRPTDIMARYGGEEFIITLTHTDTAGAIKVAERLREGVSEIVLQTPTGPISFTISIGISTHRRAALLEQIIGAADRALYAAKAAGRNRVCAATDANPIQDPA